MEMEESFLVIYKVVLKALWQVRHAHCPTGSLYDCVGLNLFTVAEDKNSLHLLGNTIPIGTRVFTCHNFSRVRLQSSIGRFDDPVFKALK